MRFVGLLFGGASSSWASMPSPPRLLTSYSKVLLPRDASTGRSTRKSVLNVTKPRPSRGASLRSAISALAGAAGSSANQARPRSFSYAPDEPNDVRRREVLAFQDFKPLNACLRMRYRHRQREQQLRNATAERAVAAHSRLHLTRA